MARILIVEDEPNIALSLDFLMRQEGHDVRRAGSVAAARAALDAAPPDLVLLDVALPDGSGVDLCRAIRQRADCAATRVLLVSARGRDADVAAGEAAGADGYVTKPFAVDDVVGRVAALLGS
jgi:DNA-binding response OmpR family regulator